MFEPITVVQILNVEQLGQGMDAALLQSFLFHDVGLAMGHETGVVGRRAVGRFSGEFGHVVERLPVG